MSDQTKKYTSDGELENRFGYHPATPITIPLHEQVRTRFFELAIWMNDMLPEGREKSLAFTALQEAAMWSNGAIACQLAPLEPIKEPLPKA